MQFVKIILLLISLIGTSWTLKLASLPNCPIDEPSINLPHEDCSKYYSCSHGTLTEISCPLGLHFHPESDRCEDPSIANCENKPIRPTCQTSDKPFVPHEINCSKFYVCIPNEKYELNCRENWIFDYKLQNCVIGTESSCK